MLTHMLTCLDYFKCIVSTVVGLLHAATDRASVGNLLMLLAPYYGLLSAFIMFVIWNGSVVLGDKSNHVATLHIPQMLYTWPYIVFFSWPVLLPHAIDAALSVVGASKTTRADATHLRQKHGSSLTTLISLLLFMLTAAVVVKYNTIVHPFTLADNRHYVFYIFRILMRPWWIRYAVIPAYALCAWLCIRALASFGTMKAANPSEATKQDALDSPESGSNGPRTAFVLAWLATTTLQLVTAPLVEPRYFILPWLIWRLNIPASDASASKRQLKLREAGWLADVLYTLQTERLWLETLWYLVINGVTGYIFLYKGFTWTSEPGNTQRFMW